MLRSLRSEPKRRRERNDRKHDCDQRERRHGSERACEVHTCRRRRDDGTPSIARYFDTVRRARRMPRSESARATASSESCGEPEMIARIASRTLADVIAIFPGLRAPSARRAIVPNGGEAYRSASAREMVDSAQPIVRASSRPVSGACDEPDYEPGRLFHISATRIVPGCDDNGLNVIFAARYGDMSRKN